MKYNVIMVMFQLAIMIPLLQIFALFSKLSSRFQSCIYMYSKGCPKEVLFALVGMHYNTTLDGALVLVYVWFSQDDRRKSRDGFSQDRRVKRKKAQLMQQVRCNRSIPHF